MKYTTALAAQEGMLKAITTTEAGVLLAEVTLAPLTRDALNEIIEVMKGIRNGLPEESDTRH